MVDYPFEINYANVIRADDLMECTRELARVLKHNPYLSFGDYMTELPTAILEDLLQVSDSEEHEHFDELVLISEMLSRAEGLDASQSDEESLHRLKVLISVLAIEGLARKGFVKAYRENYSFGEDMMNKMIAKRIDDDDGV